MRDFMVHCSFTIGSAMTDRAFVGGLVTVAMCQTSLLFQKLSERKCSPAQTAVKKHTTANPKDCSPHYGTAPSLGKFLNLKAVNCFFKTTSFVVFKPSKPDNTTKLLFLSYICTMTKTDHTCFLTTINIYFN